MKVDFKEGTLFVGNKSYDELDEIKQATLISNMNKFLKEHTKLSSYEEDCVWMSYRYCIGRHTIASHMHAGDIWKHCRGRMSPEHESFTAYDINEEIKNVLSFGYPSFRFPSLSKNTIQTTAVDMVCEFIEEYNINSNEEFLKYKDVNVIYTDNERGYKFETTTWEEYFRVSVKNILNNYYNIKEISDEVAESTWNAWLHMFKGDEDKVGEMIPPEITDKFADLYNKKPNPEYYSISNFEDLFVWNDLTHCFDHEHHHKSILQDGSECTWFWSWKEKREQHDDGYNYKAFGYERIRVPLDKWNGSLITWIPDESIKEDIC